MYSEIFIHITQCPNQIQILGDQTSPDSVPKCATYISKHTQKAFQSYNNAQIKYKLPRIEHPQTQFPNVQHIYRMYTKSISTQTNIPIIQTQHFKDSKNTSCRLVVTRGVEKENQLTEMESNEL